MAKNQKQKKKPAAEAAPPRPKEFLDLIAPAAVKFNTDHYIMGGTYRSVMALRAYPPVTEELALLRRLGEMEGVTLHLSTREVTAAEENAILHAAANKTRMERSNLNNMKQSVTAEAKLQDTEELIRGLRRNQEPLVHCAVFLELSAKSLDGLRGLKDAVQAVLLRSKLSADPLLLRQREGFLSVNPAGKNAFGSFAERVLPASSAANLYPISYSGKTDPRGFYIGRDKYGTNIILDLDRRAPDKTNGSAIILGNSGQGKSFLLKLLLCNVALAGKSVIEETALQKEPEITVLKVEPGKAPEEVTIPNTLEAMQQMVGGLIEIVYLDGVCLVCNEEGKLMGLEGNRRVGRDIISGTFFLAGDTDYGEFCSLTQEQLNQFSQRFAQPETFRPEELENAFWMEFHTF